MSGTAYEYPFSAIVGQDRMKTALLIASVDPGIGGVLIRGHKGTAKTTAVRALRSLLPRLSAVKGCTYNCPPDDPSRMHDGCLERFERGERLECEERPVPLVELPLNATEDRVAGTLHLENALLRGERTFEPGLLARANRGILYIDEVNLLEDHLVDLLLDAAATGVNTVEREGISVRHPAGFLLVGTMNPEEGELRPQFLDRFALCVNVTGSENTDDRLEIVRRRLDYERDPEAFAGAWKAEEALLASQVIASRARLSDVEVPEPLWKLTVNLTVAAGVQGHRADIAVIRAARALSALLEKPRVDEGIIREAARLVLVHRIASDLHGSHEETEKEVERIITGSGTKRQPSRSAAEADEDAEFDLSDFEAVQVPGAAAAGTLLFDFLKKKLKTPQDRTATGR